MILKNFIEKYNSIIINLGFNIFLITIILLLFDQLSILNVNSILNLNWLLFVGVSFGIFSFVLWQEKLNDKKKNLYKKIIKFLFLFFLFLIIINSIFNFFVPFINFYSSNQILFLYFFTIVFGIVTFWQNKKFVSKIEKENKLEKKQEKKRKKEFPNKFLRISKIPIFRRLVKWKYKKGLYFGVLILILMVGFLIRFILLSNANFDLDEGIHTYDAKLIFENKIPFKDYITREPYFIYSLSFFLNSTEFNIFYSRFFSVIFSILSGLVLYFISKRYSKKAGILAISIYLLSPFFLNTAYLANFHTLFYFIILTSYLFLLRFLEKKKVYDLIIFGLLIGSSTHFFRIGIFYLFFIFSLIIINLNKIKTKDKFIILITSFLTFSIPLIYFSIISGYKNFEILYGTNELLIIFFLSGLFLLISNNLRTVKNMIFNNKILLSFFYLFIYIFFITFFYLLGQSIEIKSRVLFQGFIMSYFFIFPLILIFLDYLYKKTSYIFYILSKFFFLSIIYFILVNGSTKLLALQAWGLRANSKIEEVFFVLIFLSLFLILYREKISFFKYHHKYNINLIYCVIPLFFYISHVQIFPTNFALTSLFVIPILSYNFLQILKSKFKIKYFYIIFLLILLLLPIFFYQIPMRDRLWSQNVTKEVINDINNIDKSGDYILTAAPIFAIESGKNMILDNSRPTIYIKGDPNNLRTPPYINLTKNSVSLKEYIIELEETKPRIMILDLRLKSIILSQEDLKNYVDENYIYNKTYIKDDLELWIRKGN